jgi:hypothetical protein
VRPVLTTYRLKPGGHLGGDADPAAHLPLKPLISVVVPFAWTRLHALDATRIEAPPMGPASAAIGHPIATLTIDLLYAPGCR